ncbi:hypothetical protein AAC387_Pa07g2466 [Persea americana]
MRRPGELLGRRSGHRPLKQPSDGMRGLAGRMSIKLDDLWGTAASGDWRPSSTPRSDWPHTSCCTNHECYTCAAGIGHIHYGMMKVAFQEFMMLSIY